MFNDNKMSKNKENVTNFCNRQTRKIISTKSISDLLLCKYKERCRQTKLNKYIYSKLFYKGAHQFPFGHIVNIPTVINIDDDDDDDDIKWVK